MRRVPSSTESQVECGQLNKHCNTTIGVRNLGSYLQCNYKSTQRQNKQQNGQISKHLQRIWSMKYTRDGLSTCSVVKCVLGIAELRSWHLDGDKTDLREVTQHRISRPHNHYVTNPIFYVKFFQKNLATSPIQSKTIAVPKPEARMRLGNRTHQRIRIHQKPTAHPNERKGEEG